MNENDGQNPTPPAEQPASLASGRIDQLRRRIEAGGALPTNRRRSDLPGLNYSSAAAQPHLQPSHTGPEGFLEYWRMLRRRKWMLALTMILGGIAGLLFTLPQTPVYQASTTLEVLDMSNPIVGIKETNNSDSSAAPETNLQTQVDILGSGTLQNRVIHKLVSSEKTIEQPIDRLAKWRKVLNLPQKDKLSKEEILRQTSEGVNVSATSLSRIIRIDVDSSNPRVAADYANTLAEEFIDERLESHWQATQRTSDWLTRQLEELKVRLVASEDELQAYAKQTNLQFTGEQDNKSVSEEKLSQLQTELSTAMEDRVAKQSRYELAQKAPTDTLPEVVDDESLRANRQKLADARHQLDDALVTYVYGGTPKVKKLQSDVTAIEAEITATRSRILDRIHNELVVAQTRERLLTQALESQAGLVSEQASKAVHYNILKREVDTNRQVYETLLQRVKEAGIAAAMRSSNFRVVDPAEPPTIPVRPSLRRGAMAGLLLGLFAGIGLVFVRENMDRSIALPGETSYYLSAPELAVVPSNQVDKQGLRLWGKRGQKVLEGNEAMVERSAFNHADSMVAESFRVALTSLLFANKQQGPPKAIAVSSPGPHEGKTTVACNLAISYAEINWRVLLIDGDMRRPRLHSIFGVNNETGLASLLERTTPTTMEDLTAAIQPTAIQNLSIMPRGKLRSTVINLLYSPRFSEVMKLARKEFDIVVIDTPPMLHLPDARAIAPLTDGVVFVVRSGKTLRDTVITARERFRQDGIPVLGSILNDWNPKETGYYGHDNYEDYRESYYGKEPSGRELT